MPFQSFLELPKRDAQGNVVLGPDGQPVKGLMPNPIKEFVQPYWLVPTQKPPSTSIVLGAGGNGSLDFLVDSKGHFDWGFILGSSTGAYALEFFDSGRQKRLSNFPVHSATIVGTGKRMFRLPQPYFINVGDSQRVIQCKVYDLSGATNTIKLVLYGRRIYHNWAPEDIRGLLNKQFTQPGDAPYAYFLVPKETKTDGTVPAIAASGTGTFQFQSDPDGHTELMKFMASFNVPFSYEIREQWTGRTLDNGIIENTSGWGTAEFPFNLGDSYLLPSQKVLILEVTNLSAVTALSLYATMAGRRLDIR